MAPSADMSSLKVNAQLDAGELKALLPHLKREGAIEAMKEAIRWAESRGDTPPPAEDAGEEEQDKVESPPKPVFRPRPVAPAPKAVQPTAPAPKTSTERSIQWTGIKKFLHDASEYNQPVVNVWIKLEGVGAVRDQITCDFTASSFDLKIRGLNGVNYRLFRENLDKDIIPSESRFLIKKNKVTLKLKKVKGEYAFESWSSLVAKGGVRKAGVDKTKDPGAGIMDLMKDMYQDGDDATRKMIGEAMLKSRRGEKMSPADNDIGGLSKMSGMAQKIPEIS